MHQTGYDALYEMYMHVILEHKFMLIWGRIYFSFWGKPYSKVNLLQNQAYATLILIPSKILSILRELGSLSRTGNPTFCWMQAVLLLIWNRA